jgi:hypothetical protein
MLDMIGCGVGSEDAWLAGSTAPFKAGFEALSAARRALRFILPCDLRLDIVFVIELHPTSSEIHKTR